MDRRISVLSQLLSINTDYTNLIIRKNLNNAQNAMSVALNRMSTGFRINSAKDDAAGLYIATGLTTQIRGYKQAQKNAHDGIAYLQTADGALTNMQSLLNRLRDLSVQASNGTYSDESRDAMQKEADALIAEVFRLRQEANFNNKPIFGDDSSDSGFFDNLAKTFSIAAKNPPANSSVKEPPKSTDSSSSPPVKFRDDAIKASGSGRIIFDKPNIDDPNIISGAVNFTKGQTQEVEIDGVLYTCKNNNTGDSQISFTKDLITGELTFMSSRFEIKGQKDKAHNLIVEGEYNNIYTGDLNDTVRDTTKTVATGGNTFFLGDGDDIANFTNSQTAYGEGGNDTLTLKGSGNIQGGDGDDILTLTRGSVEGGAGNDKIILKNGIQVTANGGDGDDEFILQGGQDNFVDGGAGTNSITDNAVNTTKMNVPGANALFINFDKSETKTVNINGIDYKITNGGNSNNLIYEIESDGFINFKRGTNGGFNIEGDKNVAHKVKMGVSGTFRGGDLNDHIIATTNSTIYGGKGDDILEANNYNVTLYGEDGNDTIYSNYGGGYIYGGNGDDTIYFNSGDYANGDDGNDTIYVNDSGRGIIMGGNGDDNFIVKNGVNSAAIDGGAGRNTLVDNGINTMFVGFPDSNSTAINLGRKGETKTVKIGGINYTFTNNNERETTMLAFLNPITGEITFKGNGVKIEGEKSKEHNVIIEGIQTQFYGGDLDDKIVVNGIYNGAYGGKGNDTMISNRQVADVYGEEGDDNLLVNSGSGYGGDGDDTITIKNGTADGGDGNDIYNVEANNVKITGSTGNNVFNVYGNNNVIEGGGGTDTFNILGNNNTVRGMGGNDFFLVDGTSNNIDGGTGTNVAVDNGSSTSAINISRDPYSGVLNFTSVNEEQTFTIDGKTYTVKNQNADGTSPATNTLYYNLNQNTGEIILTGSNLTITAHSNQEDNLVLRGDNNTINGGDKNDKILIQSGTNNIAQGGDGNDIITTVSQGNSVFGDAGNDVLNINASSGSHTVSGGDGDDKINIKGDNNTDIQGNGGNDEIIITGKNNIANLGAGSDKVTVEGTGNKVSADSGNNSFVIKGDTNTITGGTGNDNIGINGNRNNVESGSGNDKVNIYGDNNTASSSEGSNIFNVHGETNKIQGGINDDKIILSGDGNIATGGEGNDKFIINNGFQNNIDGNEGYNTMVNKGVETIYKT